MKPLFKEKSLSELGEIIRNLNEVVSSRRGRQRNCTEHIQAFLILGICLHEARERVPKKEWGFWLQMNAPRLNPRTARNYVKVSDAWFKNAEVADAKR